MDYKQVKRTIAGDVSKLGLKLRYEPGTVSLTKQELVLPSDVPSAMSMVLLGKWLREKPRIINKDESWIKRYPGIYHNGIRVWQRVRGDHDAFTNGPGYTKLAFLETLDYDERKEPRADMEEVYQVVEELILRALPVDVGRAHHTKNYKIKRFFKKHKGWRKGIVEVKACKLDAEGIKTFVRWSDWLTKALYEFFACGEKAEAAKEEMKGKLIADLGEEKANEVMSFMDQLFSKSKGCPGMGSGFTGVDAHDLELPKPKQTLLEDLASFFRAVMEEKAPYETGQINPARLPTFWQDPEDLFKTEEEKKQKRVKVYLIGDCSGSTEEILKPSYDTIFQAIAKGMGLVANAADIVASQYGYDIAVEATAFNGSEHTLKHFDDSCTTEEMVRRYTQKIGGGTILQHSMDRIEEEVDEPGTKSFVFLFTDGDISDEEVEALGKLKGDKKWVIIGVGDYIEDGDAVFCNVAKDTPQLEAMLVKAVKESMGGAVT